MKTFQINSVWGIFGNSVNKLRSQSVEKSQAIEQHSERFDPYSQVYTCSRGSVRNCIKLLFFPDNI